MDKKRDLLMGQFEHMLEGLSGSEKVYAHLLQGTSLPVHQFAELLQLDTEEAKQVLAAYGETDGRGQVTGFLGLSLVPTQHKLTVKDQTRYTWCAADAVILPQLLSFSALIASQDPVNGLVTRLSVNEDFLEWTDPVPLYISWLDKPDSHHVRHSCFQHSHFFASWETAAVWLAENADANISNVEEAFTFVRGGRGCC